MSQLFDIPPIELRSERCGTRVHAEPVQCGSRVIYYCRLVKYGRIFLGQKEIKLKNVACDGYLNTKIEH
jgi:hypothetical protein